MKVQINATTDGKGYWSQEPNRTVIITKIDIGYSSLKYYPEDPFFGELRAYFDASGFTPGSWNIDAYGLIYTDKRWLREFKKGLRDHGFSIRAVRDISYSEQGMQGDDYVSMDIGPEFYKSWLRLQNKEAKEKVTENV